MADQAEPLASRNLCIEYLALGPLPSAATLQNSIKISLGKSAEECARAVKLSYSHMALLLRKECGAGFGELLLARRLEEAKKLLLTTQLSITEIGAEVGFTDTSYFIKRFGERLGTTPLKYRESNLSVIS